jgi:hypothetical protein
MSSSSSSSSSSNTTPQIQPTRSNADKLPPGLRKRFEERRDKLKRDNPDFFQQLLRDPTGESHDDATQTGNDSKLQSNSSSSSSSSALSGPARLEALIWIILLSVFCLLLWVNYDVNVISVFYDYIVAALDPGLDSDTSTGAAADV